MRSISNFWRRGEELQGWGGGGGGRSRKNIKYRLHSEHLFQRNQQRGS